MKKSLLYIILTTAIAIAILFFNLKPVFQHPNSILYSQGGDALKSYYNFSYYLKYDRGIRHDGINYPYGDHLQYINSHPLFVQIIKFVDQHIYPLANHGVALLNLCMLILFVLALPFIFLILKHYSLPNWYAAIVSLIILFLGPQFDRIHGHFEMVYAVFIPMYWYFLIRWKEDRNKLLWGSLLILASLVGGFTSAYLVAFYSILLLGTLLVEIWEHRKNLGAYFKSGLILLALAVLPLLIVKGTVAATDWVHDRPNNPYGFFVYHANFLSVFLPFISPLKALLEKHINMNFQWEGRAYVGLPASLLAVSIFFAAWFRLLSKKQVSLKFFFPERRMNNFVWASVLVLLFSMCIPFKYGFGWLLELLPPVKQFRALGRFTWIFYYIFTVYAAWFFYRSFRFLRLKKAPLAATLLLIFTLSYWSIDAGTNIKRSTRGLLNKNDKFEAVDSEFLARFKAAGVSPDEFQAIFFLPFASTCGDKLLFEHSLTGFAEAMKCAYHTGIPIVQSFSPRLSFSQALSSIQMLAHPALRKTRLDDMNEKPLLLVYAKEKLNDREQWLLQQAKIFWEDKHTALARLPLSVFRQSHQNWINKIQNSISTLPGNDNFRANCSPQTIIFNDFEDHKSEHIFEGQGAFYLRKGQTLLMEKNIDDKFTEGTYELSFWLFVDSRIYDMPQAELKLFDKQNKPIFSRKMNTRQVHDVFNGWIRVSEKVNIAPNQRLQLVVKGKYISIDNLLFKPADANIWIKESKYAFFNNYPIEP